MLLTRLQIVKRLRIEEDFIYETLFKKLLRNEINQIQFRYFGFINYSSPHIVKITDYDKRYKREDAGQPEV